MSVAAVSTQAVFAAALLDPAHAAPPGLRAWNGSDPAARFAVHRNNVVLSLIEALADTFPVVRARLGADRFHAIAREFVAVCPPASPVLAEYGERFADWLADLEFVRDQPDLPDLARLERARVRACHAADRAPLDAQALAARLATPERLAAARLELHPSLQALDSSWAVVSLWGEHQIEDQAEDPTEHPADDPPEDSAGRRDDEQGASELTLPAARAEAGLVLRDPRDEVLVLPVAPADLVFVRALAAGWPLGEAVQRAAEAATAAGDPDFDLASLLGLLIRHGALVAWHDGSDDT
jgi:hypothetical protein